MTCVFRSELLDIIDAFAQMHSEQTKHVSTSVPYIRGKIEELPEDRTCLGCSGCGGAHRGWAGVVYGTLLYQQELAERLALTEEDAWVDPAVRETNERLLMDHQDVGVDELEARQWKTLFTRDVLPALDMGWRLVGDGTCVHCYDHHCPGIHSVYGWLSRKQACIEKMALCEPYYMGLEDTWIEPARLERLNRQAENHDMSLEDTWEEPWGEWIGEVWYAFDGTCWAYVEDEFVELRPIKPEPQSEDNTPPSGHWVGDIWYGDDDTFWALIEDEFRLLEA